MRLKNSLFFVLLVFITSCNISKKKPDNILSEEKLAEVLVDVQLLEATYNSRLLNTEDRKERMNRYYAEIFEHHGISEKTFDESYAYYENFPEELENIYELVFEKLEKKLTEEETRNKKKIDPPKKP